MTTHATFTVEPSAEVLEAARRYITPIRKALDHEFLAAYITGSALTQAFDVHHSRVNLLVIARSFEAATLDAVRAAIPTTRKPPRFDPLFLNERQVLKSLDAFPIEWMEMKERHLRLEGEDVFARLEVPPTYLRLQCEHELRGKHIRLRQTYLLSAHDPAELGRTLRETSSGFATLFRTLIRLKGESPPAETGHAIGRVADLFGLDAQHLFAQHLVRYSGRRYKAEEMRSLFLNFLLQIDRLVVAIDNLEVR